MSVFQALVLGVVQGLTEFLPISSSGHLIIIPKIFNWPEHTLAFDLVLHLGTAAALIVYFWKDYFEIAQALFGDVVKQRSRLKISQLSAKSVFGLKLLLACVPAGILGLVLDKWFEQTFRTAFSVGVFMFLGTLLILYADHMFRHKQDIPTYSQSLVIGLFQSLALFPGVSRSGATISGGLMLGLKREDAARFSFMLSVPIVVAAGLFKLAKGYSEVFAGGFAVPMVGFVASFVVGVLCIKFLLDYLKTRNLDVFVVYRFVVALLLIMFVK